MSVITLTTDFGTTDWFVGTMKGVILQIDPNASIVDITHAVPPGDIRSGAFALASASPYFPPNTIHVAVVDPGVGSNRPMIAVRTRRSCFVGPDNGVLSQALGQEQVISIHRLENERYFLPFRSNTFHGRDIFAPVAGHLSRGIPLKRLGPSTSGFQCLPLPPLAKSKEARKNNMSNYI